MFFRIDRTGPPDHSPARSLLSVRCPHPPHSRLDPRRASRVHRPVFFKTSRGKTPPPSSTVCTIIRRVDPRDIPARAGHGPARGGRLPARHAHTCHAPSGFRVAAGALRPSLGPTDIPVSRSVPVTSPGDSAPSLSVQRVACQPAKSTSLRSRRHGG
jgi:hypothetical protein